MKEKESEDKKMIEELMKAANLLRTVKVDGEYWMLMAACTNSIVKVANELRKQQEESEAPEVVPMGKESGET